MKKVVLHILVTMLPYLLVMTAWVFSFGAFGYKSTVTGFYMMSTFYWLFLQWLGHYAIYENIS